MTAARIEKIRAVKRRNYLRRMGFEAETLGLEEDHKLALKIEKYRKELLDDLARVRKISPRKGMKHQTTIFKEAQKRSEKALKRHQRDYDPRFDPKGVPGLEPEADGKIGLAKAKQLRPDLFDSSLSKRKREMIAGDIENAKRIKRNRSQAGGAVSGETEEGGA